MSAVKTALLCLVILSLAACSNAAVRQQEEQLVKSSQFNTELGLAYLKERDLELALIKLTKAVEQDPKNAKAQAAIAVVYENMGRADKADGHYIRSVELDPSDSYARNAYAVFLCRKGEVDVAMKHFDAAVDNPLYPQPEVALTNAGQCLRARDPALAEKYLRAALRRNPQFAQALFQMSRISFEQGNALSARGYLQRYQAVAKPTPQTLWLGIQVERELGDRNAVASYSQLLQGEYPDSEEARLLLESKRQ